MKKEHSEILTQLIANSEPLSKKTLLENAIIVSKRLSIEIENLENLLLEKQKQLSINQILLISVELEQYKNQVIDLGKIIQR